jgi:hypothetical protein
MPVKVQFAARAVTTGLGGQAWGVVERSLLGLSSWSIWNPDLYGLAARPAWCRMSRWSVADCVGGTHRLLAHSVRPGRRGEGYPSATATTNPAMATGMA